ncbi:MAG: hypothetical protein AB8G86_08295 [Saprospiraceae bacterium]
MYGNKEKFTAKIKANWKSNNFERNRPITRAELAVLLDQYIHPFKRSIDMEGNWKE